MMVGYKMNDKPDGSLIESTDYPTDQVRMVGRVEDLIRFIENKYVDELNGSELIEEAVTAVFSKLDPHSIYLTPSQLADVSDQMNGTFSGIGIENIVINDTVNIYNVLPSSPAELAGLQVFDKIVSINDSIVAGKSIGLDQIRNMLKNEAGKQVSLGIYRDAQVINKIVTVGEVPLPTVTSFLLPEIETAYIKIDRFGSKTYSEFMDEVEKYFVNKRSIGDGDKKAKHLILDLRDNPGGYLPEATNLLGQLFPEKGKLMVYTEGRKNKKNEYKTIGEQFFIIEQVVVLIDENSASASEIVAGAVQDWDRGFVVGRRSFGKGLVQEQYDLNNGGAIRLTVARYFTPSGRSIQRDYTDRNYYDDDFYDRYKNGDLFFKDSLLIKDTTQYFTQELKRPVSALGGITPDIFIPLDAIFKNEKLLIADSYLHNFCFRYISKQKGLFPKQLSGFEAMTLPTDIIADLTTYLVENEPELTISVDELALLNSRIKDKIAAILYDKEFDKSMEFKRDAMVSKASELIKNKTTLANFNGK